MTLEQKLQQLNLAAMSHQIEQTIAEAAAKNMSVGATLEWLADMELEARTGRAIDRRFKSSRLQSRPTIDGFQFHHHKSRVQAKNRILRLLDLNFLREGTNLVLIGNPGVGKTFLAKVIGWKACQANQRVLFTTAMDMLNQLSASQVDHSLVRKLKGYTEPSLLIRSLPLSRPTLPSLTGATFFTTPRLPRPLPTGWWRTPRSSCSEATVFARPTKTPLHRKSNRFRPRPSAAL
jgi:DNA replication protein DnaC